MAAVLGHEHSPSSDPFKAGGTAAMLVGRRDSFRPSATKVSGSPLLQAAR